MNIGFKGCVFILGMFGWGLLVLILTVGVVKETYRSLKKDKKKELVYDCIIIPTHLLMYDRWVVY